MKRKSTAYQYANRLAAQQLKPLREFVEGTTAKSTSGESGQRNRTASQATRTAKGVLSK